MALPIADAGTGGADIPYPNWLVTTTRSLSDGGSTPGTGAVSISSRQWTLISKPSGSAASLTGSTTATPTLIDIDMAGNYLVMLVVTDNLGAVSETDQFEAPASAFVVVRATTQYGALYSHANAQRDHIDEIHHNIDRIDNLFRPTSRVAWIQAHDGDADANGSPSNPFNPVSAAANSFAGPWAQAIDALKTYSTVDNPASGLTIVAMAGDYSEAVSITSAWGPWRIMFNGLVIVSSLTHTSIVVGEYAPTLSIGPMGAGVFSISGTMQLGNIGAPNGAYHLDSVQCTGAVSMSGSFTATDAKLYARNCTFGAAFTIPSLQIEELTQVSFGGTLSVSRISRALQCSFRSVTLTAVGASWAAGFIGCSFNAGATPLFSGPAGSAKFDAATAANFSTADGSYADSASQKDHIEKTVRRLKGKYANAPTTQTTIQTLDSHTLEGGLALAGASLDIEAHYYMANNANSKTMTIAIDGVSLVSLTDTTPNASAKLRARIDMTGPSAGVAYYHTQISSPANYNANAVILGAGSAIQARATTPSANGDLTLISFTITYYPPADN